MVYASSPLAQPATHTRNGSSGARTPINAGTIWSFTTCQVSASRKKLVTLISTVSNSAANSSSSPSRWCR